ncbi:MAG: hypothetical protein ACLFVJ_06790 [Persicimonas sp.]
MRPARDQRRPIFAQGGRVRQLLVALAAVALIAAGGCEKLSCQAEPKNVQPDNAARWAEKTRLADLVPKTARTVVFSRDLPTMAEALQFGASRLPHQDLEQAQSAARSVTELDPFAAQTLTELGLDERAPAVLFYDRGYWTIGAGIQEPERLEGALTRVEERADITHGSLDYGPLDLDFLASADGEGARVYIARDEQLALFSVRVDRDYLGADDKPGLPAAWLESSNRPRFLDEPQHRELFAELTTVGELVGVIRPAAWLAGGQNSGKDRQAHAQVLRERLLGQIGPVGFAASSVSLDESASLRVLTPGNPGSPVMLSNLGKAEGDIPPLGGLIEPGVLGVARLSVSPQSLYDLLVSSLPAQRRQELGTFWDELDRELRVNFQRDILDNIRGHAVVVAYGLDRRSLESSQAHWLLEVLMLEATREALLIPIKEREPLEQVLNGLTTVSKGKLTRQAVGHTLQYAWFEDDELKWALILSDEHVIFVDSAVAFEHAGGFEKRARPLGARFEQMGITRLFEEEHEAGLYLDTASLKDILDETDYAGAARWLEPFHSVVITTRTEGREGTTDIELKMEGGGE